MSKISLYRLPKLDPSYQNAPCFYSIENQRAWIEGGHQFSLDAEIKVELNRTSLTVDIVYSEIERLGIDYVSLVDAYGKTLYYFVLDYEYVSPWATTLILSLDALQTYMFDIGFLESFVDRCHVNRLQWDSDLYGYKPIGGTIDEGLQFGDLVLNDVEEQTFEDKYIITSTTPLGINAWKRPASAGGGGGAGGDSGDSSSRPPDIRRCWEAGVVSNNLLRFAKGYEAFYPKRYWDVDNWAITYGIGEKSEKDLYDQLYQKSLNGTLREEDGASALYTLLCKRYGAKILDYAKNNFRLDSQQKYDALADLAYNAGPGAVTNPRNSLPKILAQYPNDESKVRPVWEKYLITDGKQVLQGLKDRRKAECDIYFGKGYERRNIAIANGGFVTDNNGDGWMPSGGC